MLGGCAGTTGPVLGEAAKAQAGATQPETDCGRISGRMQVRILSLRAETSRTQPTLLSRGLQVFSTSVGATDGGSESPDGRHARELAELNAMNARLKELGCKSYDLEAELQQTDPSGTPRPR